MGTNVMLELQDGTIRYQNEKGAVRVANLYKNYAHEEYKVEMFKRPKKGSFLMDRKARAKMVEDVLLENINDVIEADLQSRN